MKLVKQGAVFRPDRVIPEAISEAKKTALKAGVEAIKEDTPKRTGKLAEGFYSTASSIENRVPYAIFVEAGTRYFEGHWMIRQNAGRIEEKLTGAIGQEVSERLQ